MKKDLTVIMAFDTMQEYNQLDMVNKVYYIKHLTAKFGGATLTEHLGGYTMDDDSLAVEYSYTFELFGLNELQYEDAINYFKRLGRNNNQESIIINGDFIYTNK